MEILKKIFKENWVLIIILVIAIFLRLSFLFLLNPPLIWIDSSDYHQAAVSLIQGNGYSLEAGVPFANREPGYSLFFLAPIYFLFGQSIFAVQIIQIILSLIIIWLIFRLAKKYFSQKAAVIAALFFAFYPPLIAYSNEILTEIPFTFLLILTIFLIIKAFENDSLKLFILSGIFLGIATLTRFIAVFLPIFLLPFFYFFSKDWRKTIKYFLSITIVLIIFIFPWLLRNYLIFDTFIFGRLTSGEIFWSGSYIPWDGEWKGGDVFPVNELTKGLNQFEINEKLTNLAWNNIKENPLGVFLIWLKKPFKIFFKSEFNAVLERENKFAEFFKEQFFISPGLIKGILLGINVLIILFAFLGVFSAFSKNKFISTLFLLVIFYFIIFYLPLNPDSRYKLPLMPYIMVFSSVGLCWLFNRILFFVRQHNKALI